MSDTDYDNDGCPNCGGEGVIYCCVEEYACIDPDGGCDLCERRCDWCNPPKKAHTMTSQDHHTAQGE